MFALIGVVLIVVVMAGAGVSLFWGDRRGDDRPRRPKVGGAP